MFLECSAKTRVNVEQCFEELVLKVRVKSVPSSPFVLLRIIMSKSQTFVYVQILETPSLTAEGSSGGKNIFKQNPAQTSRTSSSYCCSS